MKSHFFNLPLRFATALCLLLLAMGHPAFGSVTFSGDTIDNSTFLMTGNNTTGTLALTATNSFNGYIVVNSGTLSFQSQDYNILPWTISYGVPITINSGAVVSADQSTQNAHNIGLLTLNGGTLTSINGPTGPANDDGFGNFVLRDVVVGGSSMATISSTTVQLVGGNFNVANVCNGTDLLVSTNIASDVQSGKAATIIKSGAGTMTLTGQNTYTQPTVVNDGTLQIGNGGTTGSIIGNVTNNSSLVFNRSDEMTYIGQISGSGALIKNGSGTLVFTGDNTYTGGTSVNDGTLYLRTDLFAAQGALFSMVNLTIASGATLMSDRGNLAGNLTLNGGTWVENNGFGGSWSGSVSLGATSTFQSDYYQTVTANITGTGGLTKTGSGVLTLTGANTYTGNTTIFAGMLKVNGSTSALSLFTVASGATLGGNGTIGGDTSIYGIHSPGNSPGIQTFTGNLTYDTSGGSIPMVHWQLSGNTDTDFSAFDQIVVGGNLAFNTPTSLVLDFSGYGDLDWADTFWTTDQSWVIYDVAGTTTGAGNLTIATANWADNSGDSFNNALTGSSFSLGLQGNDLVLNYTAGTSAVPEPGQVAASLLLLSGIGIYVFKKRRRLGKSSLPTAV